LGGEGKTVEIDEAVLRKRKYNKGRRKKQIWIFGMAERGVDSSAQGNSLFFLVKNRKAETLIPIIQKYILPHTHIISDEWKSYSSLASLADYHYTHDTVCHKDHFKDSLTAACTNTIEGLWGGLRSWMPSTGVKTSWISQYLWEFMFKRSPGNTFLKFLDAAKAYRPVLYQTFIESVLMGDEIDPDAEFSDEEVEEVGEAHPPEEVEETISQNEDAELNLFIHELANPETEAE
jgi:hypothetical protein